MYLGHHHIGRHHYLSKPTLGKAILFSSLLRGKVEGLVMISPDATIGMCLHPVAMDVLQELFAADTWDDLERLAVVNGGTPFEVRKTHW